MLEQAKIHNCSHVTGTAVNPNNQSVSFPDLILAAEMLAENMKNAGVLPQEVVGIRANNVIEFIVWDIAIGLSGAISQVFLPEQFTQDASNIESGSKIRLIVDQFPQSELGVHNLGDFNTPIALANAPPLLVGDQGLYTRVYSSGTSGKIKGLNIAKEGTQHLIGDFVASFNITAKDSTIVFLPLSNFQQRMLVYGCLYTGADIHVCDPHSVFHVLRKFRPTFMVAPPIFYETALSLCRDCGLALEDILGGKTRFLVTGMAPISEKILHEFEKQSIPLREAYGITEAGMVAWNNIDQNRLGSVGTPRPDQVVSIADDGEVILTPKHPLSTGYFSPRSANAGVFENQRVYTGDIGYFDKDGFLFLSGRKKDLILCRSGKKYHPETVEKAINKCADVQQSVLLQKNNSEVTIIIIGEPKTSTDEFVRTIIRTQIPTMTLTSVIYKTTPFNTEDNTLTRNLKLNRKIIRQKFSA
jgi:long-chain acyl-CoA synthetase